MSSYGAKFEKQFCDLRVKASSLIEIDFAREEINKSIDEWPVKFGETILRTATGDLEEFGLKSRHLELLLNIPNIVEHIPASNLVGRVISAYTKQILGISGHAAKIERSFGGDLVHALYLPHVDLWRGDRRFAEIVRNSVPHYAARVVPTPSSLLAAIDRQLMEKLK